MAYMLTESGPILPPPGLESYCASRGYVPASTSVKWHDSIRASNTETVESLRSVGDGILSCISLELETRTKVFQPTLDCLDSPKSCSTDICSSSDEGVAHSSARSIESDSSLGPLLVSTRPVKIKSTLNSSIKCWGISHNHASEEPPSSSTLKPWAEPWFPADQTEHAFVPLSHPTSTRLPARWHDSAKSVGVVSPDGHEFTKVDSGSKAVVNEQGAQMSLSNLCIVSEATLRCGGAHIYYFSILGGVVGPADSAGFVFDSRVRRSNIQNICSVFVNSRGNICFRDQGSIQKTGTQIPPLKAGMSLNLHVDLNNLVVRFAVYAGEFIVGDAWLDLQPFIGEQSLAHMRSGFFSAVLTKRARVSLW